MSALSPLDLSLLALATTLVGLSKTALPGNLGGFLAPNMRAFFNQHLGGNAGVNSLAIGAVLGAILFGLTAFFKKANEIEEGHLDEIDAKELVEV